MARRLTCSLEELLLLGREVKGPRGRVVALGQQEPRKEGR